MNKIILSAITISLMMLSLGTIADEAIVAVPTPVVISPGAENVYVPATTVTTTTGTYGTYYYWEVPYQGSNVAADCYVTQPSGVNASLLGTFNVNVGGTPAEYYCYRH